MRGADWSTSDSIERTIELHATPRRVWTVLTAPGYTRQWVSDCQIELAADWQVGGLLRIVGDWHGFPLEDKGEILELEPEHVFSYRLWSSLSGLPDLPENRTVIRFELSATEGGVTLRLSQRGFQTYEIYAQWNFYWEMVLYRIRHLAETDTLGVIATGGR